MAVDAATMTPRTTVITRPTGPGLRATSAGTSAARTIAGIRSAVVTDEILLGTDLEPAQVLEVTPLQTDAHLLVEDDSVDCLHEQLLIAVVDLDAHLSRKRRT